MVYIDESKLAAYRNTIRDHKRSLLEADWQATSVERKGGMNLEMEQVAAQVDESIFEDEHEDCHDYPCQDCIETMADRAHDMADMER